jgi:hypothetical protein
MRRLDQRRLAHAPRAPQKRVVGGQAAGKALGVFDQKIAHPIDSAQKRKVDAVDARDGGQRGAVGAPDEGLGRLEIGLRGGSGNRALERLGDAAEKVGLAFERRQRTIQFN